MLFNGLNKSTELVQINLFPRTESKNKNALVWDLVHEVFPGIEELLGFVVEVTLVSVFKNLLSACNLVIFLTNERDQEVQKNYQQEKLVQKEQDPGIGYHKELNSIGFWILGPVVVDWHLNIANAVPEHVDEEGRCWTYFLQLP